MQILLEDGLREITSHDSTVSKGQEEPADRQRDLSNCQLPVRNILGTEEGGRLLTGHFGD